LAAKLGGAARFRADLVAYLDSLPVDQLAALLSELPNRQQPLGLGVPKGGAERAAA
jgi:hypothetical protein